MIAKLKNKKTCVITMTTCALCVSLVLTGCSPADTIGYVVDALTETIDDRVSGESASESDGSDNVDASKGNGIAVYDEDGMEITKTESVIDMMEAEDDTASLLSGADLVSSNDRLFAEAEDGYAYSQLSDADRNIYNEIYAILSGFEKDVILSSISPEVIDHAFKCVMVDHPEIFYVTGYSITKYIKGNTINKIKFSGQYTMDSAAAEEKKLRVEAYVTECLSGISQSASDYEKVKYVYEYLVFDNTYDLTSPNNQNILSVCENHTTVCQGYAKMTQLLLNRLDVFCTLVNGEALNVARTDGEGTIFVAETEDGAWGSHVWNIVMVDGKYYNVDTTWGDASFSYHSEDGIMEDGPEISYDYLMVPDSMLSGSHTPLPVVDMPECTSLDSCYYVREGMYFTDIDRQQLDVLFNRSYSEGEKYATIKCADSDVYDQMYEYLFDEEHIFDYMNGTSVRYVKYPDKYILSIRL